VPWIFVLAATLSRSQFPATWIGLDVCEALGLTTTGVGLLRRRPRGALFAAVTATLLAVDAWFDVTTATTGADRLAALTMAFGAEIPIAAVCVAVAIHLSASITPRKPDEPSGSMPHVRDADITQQRGATSARDTADGDSAVMRFVGSDVASRGAGVLPCG
jgi:hypothetical protein